MCSELQTLLTSLETDISTIQADVSAAAKLFKEEDDRLRKAVTNLKASTIDSTKKAISSNATKFSSDNRVNSNKNEKLLKALQSI